MASSPRSSTRHRSHSLQRQFCLLHPHCICQWPFPHHLRPIKLHHLSLEISRSTLRSTALLTSLDRLPHHLLWEPYLTTPMVSISTPGSEAEMSTQPSHLQRGWQADIRTTLHRSAIRRCQLKRIKDSRCLDSPCPVFLFQHRRPHHQVDNLWQAASSCHPSMFRHELWAWSIQMAAHKPKFRR